ncbi:SgcJ/EcaC family oxidoreductase [Paragemmobacter ruber]|uniref:SgcJ/EcaC family oxidoreductase n=1 Tax=Paragemmobacter ruber TaxID=1985673 RepID=A0ABW9Y6D0_9RHOB|nr:SgcJ/EcaC family oxidoreductase [Rhodobacter ruber]NBE08080.1 SgcJ/EcaC family oxidoreductase [Rhodobacter ruber]
MTPEDFPRAFASAFAAQDAPALAALLHDEADLITPTGQYAEGRTAIESALAAEFAGVFRAARLVKGKLRLRPLGPGAALVTQRYVVTGAQNESGAELPRCALVLTATLAATPQGWQALAAQLSLLAD